MSRFKGKYIWIIGASFGIGRQLAIDLSKAGAVLAVSGRSKDALDEVVGECHREGHLAVVADTTSQEQLDAAVAELKQQWQRVDSVIFAAGVYTPMNIDSMDMAKIEQMIHVNLLGAFKLIQAVYPTLKAQGHGNLTLTASVAGYRGLPNGLGYCASKAGLINLAEEIYTEMKPHGINVQVITPGFVKTRLTDVNEFNMPMMISVEKASKAIMKDLMTSRFHIHFPKNFTFIMRIIRHLPYWLFFPAMRNLR